MRAIIVSNGVIRHPEQDRTWLQPRDLLVAADGGLQHCLTWGLRPDLLIGDLDSVADQDLSVLQSQGVEIQRHPARKDETDLELALREIQRRGAREAIVLGGLGGRWDQSLANSLLLANPDFRDLALRLVDGPQELLCIHGGQVATIRGRPGDTVSLIPLAGNADGVHTQGLEYRLAGEALEFAATRGVSNVLLEEHAQIRLQAGRLLCAIIHQTHEPNPTTEKGGTDR